MSDQENERRYREAGKELEKAIDALREIGHKKPIYGSGEKIVEPEAPFCSFCGKGVNQIKHMVRGGNAYICNECLALCTEIIAEL